MKLSFSVNTKTAAVAFAPGNELTIITLEKGRDLYLYGDLFYYIKDANKVQLVDVTQKTFLKKLFLEEKLDAIIPRLEGQYFGIIQDHKTKKTIIFADRYTRLDLFYATHGDQLIASTTLEAIVEKIKPMRDPLMVAHLFSVYGWYAPKGKTIYSNISRLKVGEKITVSAKGLAFEQMAFKPVKIENLGDADLEKYYRLLKESIVSRSNRHGATWVSGSSGWDSSTILGILAQELGAKKIEIITGSVEYSNETKVINQFEINKIKKISDFYGIKPHIVHMDFKSPEGVKFWLKRIQYFKAKHIYSTTTFNFTKLADGMTRASGPGQVVLNGETSDSFHNFGFSQFATFFHTQKAFTEYGDKMNCYLYGPSFFQKVVDGSFKKDKVYQIFTKMAGEQLFASDHQDMKERLKAYAYPLFYGSPRIPFAKTFENPALNPEGQRKVFDFPFETVMPEFLKSVNKDNLYAWWIYLYLNFHSQGSTVAVQRYGMEHDGHSARSPYNDTRLIDLLSRAPESWGRGLDLNHCKYPLKWVAQNKIRFPYELLQHGPHSYLYDVIEGFSLLEEIMYRSAVSKHFKEVLSTRAYRDILGGGYIDIAYFDRLVDAYLAGKEIKGKDFTNLFSLSTVASTGWY